jgi:quercetin dioxygenase-like cupin family protein
MFCILLLLQPGCATPRGQGRTQQETVIIKELVRSTRSWDGQTLIQYPDGQPEITIKRVTIPAGARLVNHTHPVINAGVLITGKLKVVTEQGQVLHLKAGDPIVEVVNTMHYGVNEGTVPADIIVVYAGAVQEKKTPGAPADSKGLAE